MVYEPYKRRASASQLNMLHACKRKWYYSYILKIKEPKSNHLLKGSLIHAVAENFHQLDIQKAGIHEDDYDIKFRAYAWEVFDEQLDKPQEYFGKILPSIKEDLQELYPNELDYAMEIADAKGMIKTFMDTFLRGFAVQFKKYKNIRQAWYVSRPKFLEYDLKSEDAVGFIDEVLEKDGETIIVDLKSSQGYNTMFSVENYRQLKLYAYLYWLQTGKFASYGIVKFVRFGAEICYPFDESIIKEMENELQWYKDITATKDIEEYPMNLEHTFCTCEGATKKKNRGKGWCFYANMCDETLKVEPIPNIKGTIQLFENEE